MSQTESTIGIVTDAIIDQMTTALADAGDRGRDVSVTAGMNVGLQTADQFIVGDITYGDHDYEHMRAGRNIRTETYGLEIHIVTVRAGKHSRPARDAAMSHFKALTDLIANDAGIGLGIPTLVLAPGEFQLNDQQNDKSRGWSTHFKCVIRVTCRLN